VSHLCDKRDATLAEIGMPSDSRLEIQATLQHAKKRKMVGAMRFDPQANFDYSFDQTLSARLTFSKGAFAVTVAASLTLLAACTTGPHGENASLGNPIDHVFSDRTIHGFGTNDCSTVRRSVVQRGAFVDVTVDRPKDCRVQDPFLAIGTARYRFDSVVSGFRKVGNHYVWNDRSGTIRFRIERQIVASDLLGEFGLVDMACRSSSCLTDARVLSHERGRAFEAREREELERFRAASFTASTPGEIANLLEKLRGRDADAAERLNARLARFIVEERALISTLDDAALRSFVKMRSATATDSAAAASEDGLSFARSRIRENLLRVASTGTDEQRESVLADEYVDKEMREALIARLRVSYSARREFAPLFRLFKITNDVALLKTAQPYAKSTDDLKNLEQAAVSLTTNPGRLFSVSGAFADTRVTSSVKENMGFFANFTANVNKTLRGTVTVKARQDSPIRLRHGIYDVVVRVDLLVERDEELRSNVLGDKNSSPRILKSNMVTVRLSPPNYEGRALFDFGDLNVGYFQSGARGGYTAIRLASDPLAALSIQSALSKSE
jgi:hypothetical protein